MSFEHFLCTVYYSQVDQLSILSGFFHCNIVSQHEQFTAEFGYFTFSSVDCSLPAQHFFL